MNCYRFSKNMSRIVFVLVFLVACRLGGVSTTPLPATSLPATPIPPTLTATPPPLTSIIDDARQACAAAESAPVTGGFIPMPVMALKKVVYENRDWELAVLGEADNGLVAQDAPSVQALACIREDWFPSSYKYTDGESAFHNEWYISFVSWPGGETLGRVRFLGIPPQVKTYSGPGYGQPPVDDLLRLFRNVKISSPLLTGDDDPVFSRATFSEDGHRLAAVNSKMQTTLWDMDTGKTVRNFAISFPEDSGVGANPGFPPHPEYVAFSSTADKIAITDFLTRVTVVAEAASGKSLYTLEAGVPVFSPAGDLLAVADPTKEHIVTYEILLVDPSSGKIVEKLQNGHDHNVNSMAFSADGRWLVSGGVDQKVIVWDVESHSIVHTYESSSLVEYVAISPDGQFVAFAGRDHAQVWKVGTESTMFSSPEHPLNQSILVFSPDGNYLLFSGNEGIPSLLDLNTNDVSELLQHTVEVKAASFSLDGSKVYIVEANGTVLTIPCQN